MLISSSEAYRLWAPSYDSTPNPLLALEERLVSKILSDLSGKTVLDVGCGTGRSLIRHSRGHAQVFGADCSFEMLSEAHQKPDLRGRLVLAESSGLPLADGISDVTLCSFALSYFPDLNGSLSELRRVTKYGGRVVISDLHPSAATTGWTRSFRAAGNAYEIEHAAYSDDEFRAALNKSGLQEMVQIEAGFSEPERHFFVAAGKESLFLEVRGIPAVRVGVCSRV